ncbi:hypothetical protein JKP88DRAFT_338282 [Tribonema minus]|uniref:CAAX prenyl protease 2/Lysostaphin resistance protein A-like domain-containing protein n=1 Tax=Tribonema minus TaxID=303371 RepID=A0A835YJD5_9STRA|nr:hypothetical protein JKP88DRAFT_338282 [Tribonema minus]
MKPWAQFVVALVLYLFHMFVLSKHCIPFPVQLIPNDYGLCQSVGLDTLAGEHLRFGVIVGALLLRREEGKTGKALGGGAAVMRGRSAPWSLDRSLTAKLPLLAMLLGFAYYCSGWSALAWEYVLYGLAAAGLPLTVAMHRSLQVLLGHLVWVLAGSAILGNVLKPFFRTKESKWLRIKWRTHWLWWVVGGYYASSFLFTMADLLNQFVCPLPPDTESVVAKIINPEDNDLAALAVGSIAPCLSAPWWEEVLYRGFMLPALTLYLPRSMAVPVSAVLFAAHHLSIQAMIPLSMLGLVWALLYVLSGNLLVTIMIHGMWNSRVFLGSLLGV